MIDDPIEEFLEVLQDVVLPAGVPVTPDVDVAAHFSVPADAGEATGAWFDAVALDSGCVALAVGQVPGSDVAAVAAAASVNAVLRAGLRHSGDLATALGLVETHAAGSSDTRGAVLSVAVVDPHARSVSYAVAGLDAPLVASAAGTSRSLPATGPALGAGHVPAISREPLDDGDLVALGLGAPGLPDALAGPRAGDAQAFCDEVAARLTPGHARGALALAMAGVPGRRTPDLSVSFDRDELAARRVRQQLTEWLELCGASPMDSLSVVHATGELLSNATEHAYTDSDAAAPVEVHACHRADGNVLVDVVDHGRWRAPSDEIGRGRGLAMAAGLVAELEVTSDDHGTRARVRQPLTRPVVVRRLPDAAPGDPQVDLRREAPDRLRLVGDFGHDEVDRVGHEIVLATRAGTRRVVVDLSDVVGVSRSALRLLADVARGVTDHSGPSGVVLQASRGSLAQQELVRAGIPHDAV